MLEEMMAEAVAKRTPMAGRMMLDIRLYDEHHKMSLSKAHDDAAFAVINCHHRRLTGTAARARRDGAAGADSSREHGFGHHGVACISVLCQISLRP